MRLVNRWLSTLFIGDCSAGLRDFNFASSFNFYFWGKKESRDLANFIRTFVRICVVIRPIRKSAWYVFLYSNLFKLRQISIRYFLPLDDITCTGIKLFNCGPNRLRDTHHTNFLYRSISLSPALERSFAKSENFFVDGSSAAKSTFTSPTVTDSAGASVSVNPPFQYFVPKNFPAERCIHV